MWNGLTFLTKYFTHKGLHITLAFLGLITLSFVIFSPFIPGNISVELGQESPQTISSPRFIEFQTQSDKAKTQELINKRSALIDPIYTIDTDINKNIIANVINFFTVLKDYKLTLNDNQEITQQQQDTINILSPQLIKRYLSWSDNEVRSVEYISIQNAERFLNTGLTDIEREQIHDGLLKNLRILGLSEIKQVFIEEVLLTFLAPNLFLNTSLTNARIEEEIRTVQPFKTHYKEGQPIIYKGEKVTQEHMDALLALNLIDVKANWPQFFGILLLFTFLFILFERFNHNFTPKRHSYSKYNYLIYTIVMMVLIIGRILQNIDLLPGHMNIGYMLPIPLSGILITFLVTPNLALITGSILSIAAAIMLQADITLFMFLFLANAVSTFAVINRYKRKDVISAGYTVGAFNIAFILSIGLFKGHTELMWYLLNIGIGFANGIISAMISLAMLPYFESAFKITTTQTLLELGNLDHPLLKRLMVRAPGTYQHSLMVGNLAEAAAEAVHADPVLSRVGAYYHDIGKIKRPHFFIENQFSGENPHDSLSPRMSKIIVSSHTKEGAELADKHKLPESIKGIILSHHGTSLVSFFYNQALQAEGFEDSDANKKDFRYAGPKPASKEEGIVMLADSVEAALRSMNKPTMGKIENLIDTIFKQKLSDNQFSECPLSLKDLEVIRNTFLQQFKSIYHSRLDYQVELTNIMNTDKKSDKKAA